MVDLEAADLSSLAEKARASGHWHFASDTEIEEICAKVKMPNVSIFNQVSAEKYDVQSIRVYGGHNGKSALLWNQAWIVTCKDHFDLHHFPFDIQALSIEFRQNDPKSWDLFDLRVRFVQFHKIALEMPEWQMLEPTVIKEGNKATSVELHVRRFYWYYIQNVVVSLLLLSSVSLVILTMKWTDLGSRVSTCLTLILSSIAYKFILSATLPKVPYNTIIDYYVLASTYLLFFMTWFSVLPHVISTCYDDASLGDRVNHILMIFSPCMVCVFFLAWVLLACIVCFKNSKHKPIYVVGGKNWYAFNFAIPLFMKGQPIKRAEL
ncbi:unnamed protein product [Polarella glacialis]|uniref:Uncharacterized protein n=1 Tax=Polarella glacialis TaxID=89957 RepID=A0A813G8L4_POLGL|nr:unnamed protein product [Polarella glacialis]